MTNQIIAEAPLLTNSINLKNSLPSIASLNNDIEAFELKKMQT